MDRFNNFVTFCLLCSVPPQGASAVARCRFDIQNCRVSALFLGKIQSKTDVAGQNGKMLLFFFGQRCYNNFIHTQVVTRGISAYSTACRLWGAAPPSIGPGHRDLSLFSLATAAGQRCPRHIGGDFVYEFSAPQQPRGSGAGALCVCKGSVYHWRNSSSAGESR